MLIILSGGALHKNRTLKELCLANNQLNGNDAKSIASVLKNNFHLQLLDISNNDIQDQGFLHLADALSYQSVHVNQTSSSSNSVTSATVKFDFTDLTASLNNINNNRQRSCATPPPMPKIKLDNITDDGACSLNNNNNSILQCDSDDKKSELKKPGDELVPEAATDAMTSTKSEDNSSTNKDDDSKFKYTTASLSPISQSYDDSSSSTNAHHLFNAERSFSSESLCSETSIESNDSKSSIRLIENKFNNRNGTLERQTSHVYSTSPYIYYDEKQPTGLQVLILWNNNITSKSSSSAFDMFESAEFLEIVNFGQNPIGDEFLIETKTAIKANKSLSSIGLQATGMSNMGLKCIAEIIDGNMSLQRIDLRNNEFSAPSLMALFDALRTNKNLIRIDIDDSPKNEADVNTTDYENVVKMIREKCKFNENPAEKSSAKVIESVTSRVKKANSSTRKISLTCPSVKAPTKQAQKQQIQQQNLEPKTIKASSPALSPLPSPSRSSRFQVSRVSATESSPSPSSSSGSPTFFPPKRSRFKVVTVVEPPKAPPPVESHKSDNEVFREASVKPLPSKEIDIPQKSSSVIAAEPNTTAFLKISSPSSLLSSQSCEQLDCGVKSFIDIDSCSSFSSSIESIDHHTDMSSTESFDFIDKSPIIVESSCISEPLKILEDDDKKEGVFSNENTLVSTSSSSSSNEGLTLTTNSPTSELSPKSDAQKRVRKTSLIKTGNNYPATLDKLLNLFHHPTTFFTKTSPESTLSSSPTTAAIKPKTSSQQLNKEEKGMGQKENSLSGFFTSLVSLTQKKDEKLAANESQILQNISPENTVGKSSPQMSLEALPKCIKQEMKENISPENTISSENLVEIERQKTKVVFLVGDEDSLDIPEYTEETATQSDELSEKKSEKDGTHAEGHMSLGDKTKDSMAILREKSQGKDEPCEIATE